MDVIMLEDVDKVGLAGEVVAVSRGFHRNYLGPRRLATPATPALVAELRRREEQQARHEARSLEQARTIAETLTKTVLRFEMKAGSQGILFGAITPSDIANELWRTRRVRVDRRKIHLDEPIKRVGRYDVTVEVFTDVLVPIKTIVAPEGGELPGEELEAEAAATEQPPQEEVFEEPDWGELG
jgi:large subunit ribosomal protein L9